MAHAPQILEFPGDTPGQSFTLPVYRFGEPGARPKAYLHSALHADEHPGTMALLHLLEHLRALDEAGQIMGEIIVIPACNPFGMAQVISDEHLGRYDLAHFKNYNRGWPSLSDGLAEALNGKLGHDAVANTQLIRAAIAQKIAALPAVGAQAKWRKTLLGLSHDADLVLDLHCDQPSLVHLFIMPQLLPQWEDLAAWIGAEATLWAEDSGGGSFDEIFPTPWIQMQRAFPDLPIPLACGAATLELRAREDISDALGAKDARALLGFLGERGLHSGTVPPRPGLRAAPTALEAADYARITRPGLISYRVQLGDEVAAGQTIADLWALDVAPPERVEIAAPIRGKILSTNTFKYVRPGDSIAKVAGQEILESRKGGYLLED